jgi:hypothetical protein
MLGMTGGVEMNRAWIAAALLLGAGVARAETARPAGGSPVLQELNTAVARLVAQVFLERAP